MTDTIQPAAFEDALLHRFVRLAAVAAGASAAFAAAGVGERAVRASVGLPGDDCGASCFGAVAELAPAEGPATVMVVADLREGFFAAHGMVVGPPFLRFLAHIPLLAPSGAQVGFMCVFDTVPRAGLSEAERRALDDVACVAAAALDQERRHRMLVEVTERAGRADRMLRMVSEAGSCADALTGLLSELCLHHGAAIGRIWRLTQPEGMMQEVSRFEDPGVDEHSYYRQPPTAPVRSGNSRTAEAIRLNQPQAFLYSSISDLSRFVLMQAAIESGLRAQVSYPMWVQDQRFGIALAFNTERADLESIVSDIGSLANTIRPALFRKVTEDRIRFMAHHDELTKLGNRAVFNEVLQQAVEDGGPDGRAGGLALLYLDLDGFKSVNDSLGHEVGDRLLAAVAGRLRASVREGDTVARIGGDEFAIVQPDAGQPYASTQLARRLLETVSMPFDIDGQAVSVGVSIGIALHPADGETPDVLQRNADTALYEAKKAGRNTFRLFEASLGVMKQERFLIERDLRNAIDRGELSMNYQPIVEGQSLQVRGMEALLRWTHPTRGPLSPARFVPMAEACGLIVPLGAWALDRACRDAAGWERPAFLSVNFSPMQFRQPGLPQAIEEVLSRHGLPGRRLDLEVTEGLLLDDSGAVLRTMHELREQGIRMTLDDFGTAYASLGYLRRFPFDRIKIDRSFIQAMCDDDGTLAIVQAILGLSARLGLEVVAEGVETSAELDMLRSLGCGLVQGFLTGRPMSAGVARDLLGTAAMDMPLGRVG